MFSPLAFTLGYALLGSLILSLTYVPVMCKVLLTKPFKEKTTLVTRKLIAWLFGLYAYTCRHRRSTIVVFFIGADGMRGPVYVLGNGIYTQYERRGYLCEGNFAQQCKSGRSCAYHPGNEGASPAI